MDESSATPTWLDIDFFQAVVRVAESNPDVAIVRTAVRSGASKGDNLGSLLFRASVELRYPKNPSLHTRHLVVKSLPEAEFFRHLLAKMGVFKRELHVYQVTLPAMNSLLKSSLEVEPFAPRWFFTARPDTVVLEDLSPLGYKPADRGDQLDFKHCVLALRALARFHALSMVLHSRDPKSMSHFREIFYIEERRDVVADFLEPTLISLANVVEHWLGFERFGKKLRKMAAKAVDSIIDIVKAKEGCLAVLNHGDFWTSNLLFRYDAVLGDVSGVRFVDFQSSRFASPALDLLYFLYTSPRDGVRSQHWNALLREYHASIGNTLGILGAGDLLFSMDQLKHEMRNKAFYGLISACTDLGSVLSQGSAGETLGSEGNPFKQTFQKLLLHFERDGLL